MKDRIVTATEFKAKCLACLDQIEEYGEPITITRRGKPVAVLQPVKKPKWKSPLNSWKGRMRIVGDIVNLDTASMWNVVREIEGK
jgi:prevent-host-death family protein